ncbi:hypothetical protein GYH30_043472 [Glycine max]|nr:hypothetical protein GYH30_043472 [Glycine max]
MEVSITYEIAGTLELNPDRLRELKAFDDSKADVKGLVDGGVTKIPTLFYHPLMQRTKFTPPRDCWQNTEADEK